MSNGGTSDKLTRATEYAALRAELEQSKKYVLERPLAIAGVGLTLITTKDDAPLALLLPAVMAGLLMFNFWFMVNRSLSGARIVAYVRLVLEPGAELPWYGWECSLDKYRNWHATTIKPRQLVDREMKHYNAMDSMTYYGAIFWLHILLMTMSCVVAAFLLINELDVLTVLGMVLTVAFVVPFAMYSVRWGPARMHRMIARNVVIWRFVLGIDQGRQRSSLYN